MRLYAKNDIHKTGDFVEVEEPKSILADLKDRRKQQLDELLKFGCISQAEHDKLMAKR